MSLSCRQPKSMASSFANLGMSQQWIVPTVLRTCAVPAFSSFPCDKLPCLIQKQIWKITTPGSLGHLLWKQAKLHTFQIPRMTPATPTSSYPTFASSRSLKPGLQVNWQRIPSAQLTTSQIYLARGQEKKRWLMVSLLPKNRHEASKSPPLLTKTSPLWNAFPKHQPNESFDM